MLKRKSKSDFLPPNKDTLIKRASQMDNDSLLNSIELSIGNLNQLVAYCRQGQDVDVCLAEMKLSSEVVHVLSDELRKRKIEVLEIARARQVRTI